MAREDVPVSIGSRMIHGVVGACHIARDSLCVWVPGIADKMLMVDDVVREVCGTPYFLERQMLSSGVYANDVHSLEVLCGIESCASAGRVISVMQICALLEVSIRVDGAVRRDELMMYVEL